MALIIKDGEKWRAQARRKGHKTITKTHPHQSGSGGLGQVH